jgi:hypothetical protein
MGAGVWQFPSGFGRQRLPRESRLKSRGPAFTVHTMGTVGAHDDDVGLADAVIRTCEGCSGARYYISARYGETSHRWLVKLNFLELQHFVTLPNTSNASACAPVDRPFHRSLTYIAHMMPDLR